jgi:hypothetical protein
MATSVPATAQPTQPVRKAMGVENVVAPVHSDIPYSSQMVMPSFPKKSSVDLAMGAAAVPANLHSSRPSFSLMTLSTFQYKIFSQ